MKIKIAGVLVLVSALTAAWLASHGYTTFATPFCAEGATNATTVTQVRNAVSAGEDVCVTAEIDDDLILENMTTVTTEDGAGDTTSGSSELSSVTGSFQAGMRIVGDGIPDGARITEVGSGTLTISKQATVTDTGVTLLGADDRQIGTSENGSLGYIEVDTVDWLTLNARFRSTDSRDTDRFWIDNSIVGGTEAAPTLDQLVFLPSNSTDTLISNSDIGETIADDTGNTGYGIRAGGTNDRLHIVGNKVHDVAGDGIQGFGDGVDVLVDRNEVGPVGANPDSSEHSDTIQAVSTGDGLRITNNWFHNQGYWHGITAGSAGNIYIHGTLEADTPTVLVENNLFEESEGRMEVCGLGSPTPNDNRSNLTLRNNTVRNQGLAFPDFEGLEWDCNTGSGNVIENNVAVDPDGGFVNHGTGSTFTAADNLFGLPTLVTFDDDGNCTSSNCNPEGEDPIGYRKPTGVNW